MVSMPATFAGKALLPVKKGKVVTIGYMNLSNASLEFTYAEGSQPV